MSRRIVLFIAFTLTPALFAQEPLQDSVSSDAYTAAGLNVDYENFDQDLSDWTLVSIELKRRTTRGTLIGRVTRGDRFDRTGVQYEIDAYPKLGKGTYAYLNAGVSSDSIFPDLRLGAQIYRSLPRSWEVSLGARYLDFDTSDVTLLTGSIARYVGNWYLAAQPYFSDKDRGSSASVSGTVRRYFESRDDYFGIRGSFGEVPDQDIFLAQPVDLQSWSIGLEAKRKLSDRWVISGGAGYRDQELGRTNERQSIYASAGLEARF